MTSLPGIDFIGECSVSASFQCLDDDMAVTRGDCKHGAFDLCDRIKIGLCDLVNKQPGIPLPVQRGNE